MRPEGAFDLLALVQPKQAGVYKDAGQLVPDRTMHERCRDGRIDTTGQPADDMCGADRLANFADLVGDELPGCPRRLAPADLEQEVRDDLATSGGMRDLGMKLHAVDRTALVPDAGDR